MMPQGHIVKTSLFQIVSFYSVIGLYDVFHRFLIVYSSTPSRKEFRLRIGLYLDSTCFCIIAGFCLSLPTPYFFLFLAVHFCFKVIRVFFGFSQSLKLRGIVCKQTKQSWINIDTQLKITLKKGIQVDNQLILYDEPSEHFAVVRLTLENA